MRFGNINIFYWLWFLAALAIFFFWALKQRQRIVEKFVQKDLLPVMAGSWDKKKQYLRAGLVFAAFLLAIFSLAMPQWGFHWQEIKHKGLDIVIAVDTSKSMLAEDVKPNRINRAKLAIRDFIKNLAGDRIGLVAFAGSAFTQCPLTVDYNGFLLSLDALNTEIIPKGGTSLAEAVREANKVYRGGMKKYKVLIIITDGEDHLGDPVKAAEEAKQEGIKIFCIGIGTTEGELIPVTDETGKTSFLKDREGNVVKSRLDEATLQKIALTTGGSYVRSGSAEFGLKLIYEQKLSSMEKRQFQSKMAKQYEERFQIFLFVVFLLLLAEIFISDRKRIL